MANKPLRDPSDTKMRRQHCKPRRAVMHRPRPGPAPYARRKRQRTQLHPGWADLREDKIINPAPGFWPIFGPLGPTAGPGSPGNGPGSKNSAGCTKNQPRRPILSPIRRRFVFLGPTAKDKSECERRYIRVLGTPVFHKYPEVLDFLFLRIRS